MEPWLIEDLAIVWEERLIFEMFKGIILKRRLEGVVSILNSIDAQQFRTLYVGMSTELYLIQGVFLSMVTE